MSAAPVSTPAEPPGHSNGNSNGNGTGYHDGASAVSIPSGRRWWSFSTTGRRS